MRFIAIALFTLFLITPFQGFVLADDLWSRIYGGGGSDAEHDMCSTSDGGFAVAGQTTSFGAGNSDAWVMKFDSSGTLQWEKTYGTANQEIAYSISQTSDGGYFIGGELYTNTDGDFWVMKLSSTGAIEWQREYGTSGYDPLISAIQTTDGGYMLAGATYTSMNDSDGWLIKLSAGGNIQWQKKFHSGPSELFYSVQQTPDGGYIAAGTIQVNPSPPDPGDIWVVKLDSSGNTQWQRSYGTSTGREFAGSILVADDGGYIVAGYNALSGGEYAYLLKLDSVGNIQWQKSYGGGGESIFGLNRVSDGGFILAGNTGAFGAGGGDGWLVKLDQSGAVEWQNSYGGTSFDQFYRVIQTANGFAVAGYTHSFEAGVEEDAYILKLDSTGRIAPGCLLVSETFGSTLSPALNNTPTTAAGTTTSAIVTDTTATTTNITSVVHEQCSGNICLFCDDFEDGQLDNTWSYLKPGWNENGGALNSELTKKALAIASPFAGCSDCSFESDIAITSGKGKVSMFAWYTDSKNNVEVQLNEKADKFILKQRAPGKSGKTKALFTILPNVSYNVKVTYDGTSFSLSVNGNAIATLTAKAPPNGTIGFQTKKTIAAIGQVFVD